MKKNAIILIIVIFPCILSPTYGQWEKFVIDNDIDFAVFVDVADMDGDSKLDLITNTYGGGYIWYQNNFPHWIRHTIDEIDAPFAFTGDIDGDDTLDVVASLYFDKKMVWYENNHPTWTMHIIDNVTDNADFICVSDFDNDDTLDVVTAGSYSYGGDVVWYENNHPNWPEHIIESGGNAYPSLNVNDIDSDGFLDVIATMNKANKVVWFRNENKGLTWTKYTIDNSLSSAWGISSGDINGDSTIDIVATGGGPNYDNSDVVWYENNHPTWTKHIIDSNLFKANWPNITDVDGDDKMDVIVGGFGEGVVVWYENNHPEWTKHIIDPYLNKPRLTAVKDIDGDNINDLFIAGGSGVAWYKNPYTTAAYATSVEVYFACIQKSGGKLTIKAKLANPENHPVDVFVTIRGNESAFKDSLQLFDDGLHGDGNSADNIWGNTKLLSGLSEDIYRVDLVAHDLNLGTEVYYYKPLGLTTIGPVEVEKYTLTNDTIPSPGDKIDFKVTLRNNSSADTAINIMANLSVPDTNVTFNQYGSRSYGDIPPGETSTATGYCKIEIDSDYPYNTEIPVHVEITSDGYAYWKDTLKILVLPVNIKETREPVTMIYPNPAENILNIEICNTGNQGLEIEILNVTGTLIYQKEFKPSGVHFAEQIDLSGYTKGIYLVKIKQANSVYVGKVVVR